MKAFSLLLGAMIAAVLLLRSVADGVHHEPKPSLLPMHPKNPDLNQLGSGQEAESPSLSPAGSLQRQRARRERLRESNRGRDDYRVASDPEAVDPLMDSITILDDRVAAVDEDEPERLAEILRPATNGHLLAWTWFHYQAFFIEWPSDSFWESSYSMYWRVMHKTLEEAGFPEHAGYLMESAAVFSASGPSLRRSERSLQIEAFTDEQLRLWEQIDMRVWEAEQKSPLRPRVEAYVSAHLDEYFF